MTIILRLRGGRAAADGPLYALVILALGLVAGLLVFVTPYALAYETAVDTCHEDWLSIVLRAPSPGVALPFGLAALIVLVFVSAAARQWLATRHLIRRLGDRRIRSPFRLRRLAGDLDLDGRIDYIADPAPFAFSYGLFRTRVCLSSELLRRLSDAELRAVLLHERHHLTSHDPLKILISRAAAAGLFFLPVARELRDRYLVCKEIAADETTGQAEEGDLPLASALLKLLSGESPSGSTGSTTGRRVAGWAGGLPAIGAFNVTQERIQRLIAGRPSVTALPPLRAVLASAAIVVAVFLASYAPLAARPAQAPLVRTECATTIFSP